MHSCIRVRVWLCSRCCVSGSDIMARVSLFVAAAVLLVGAVVATETVTLSSPTFDVLAAGQAGKGWRQVGAADPEATVSITIAPKRSSLDELANFVQEVSDPKSARYTQCVQGRGWSWCCVCLRGQPCVE